MTVQHRAGADEGAAWRIKNHQVPIVLSEKTSDLQQQAGSNADIVVTL
jgi:hypothetical protein